MRHLFVAAFLVTGLAAAGAQAAQQLPIRTNTAGELADICGVAPHESDPDHRTDRQ